MGSPSAPNVGQLDGGRTVVLLLQLPFKACCAGMHRGMECRVEPGAGVLILQKVVTTGGQPNGDLRGRQWPRMLEERNGRTALVRFPSVHVVAVSTYGGC